MWAIYKKELRSYLMSPIAWTVWVVWAFMTGFAFVLLLTDFTSTMYGNPDADLTETLTGLFNFFRFVLLLICPIFTMRLFAEERQTGTLELLFTYPLTESQLLWGKYIASLTMAVIMVGITLLPLAFLRLYAKVEVDWALVTAVYTGLLLLAGTFLSLGIWASSLTNSQPVAVVITLGSLLMLWLLSALQRIPLLGAVGSFFKELSLLAHYESFSHGIINSTDVLFYLSLTAFFLFLTHKQLESRKWRG